MKKSEYGYIYKITNLINDMWYIGSARCSKDTTLEQALNDGYLGSGRDITEYREELIENAQIDVFEKNEYINKDV